MITQDQITEELKRIQASIPRSYFKGLLRQRKVSLTVKRVMELALKEPDIPEKKKQKYRELLESGDLDYTETVENKRAAERINAWVEKEIKKSIKAGRLPNKKELYDIQRANKQNDRRD